jgi:hypothetical protein
MSVNAHAGTTKSAAPSRSGLEDAGDRWLGRAAALFTVAVIIHNSDHLRRGVDKLTADVFWVGTAGILLEVGLVVLICQRHRLAPLAAAVGGLSLAGGYVEVHFLPAHRWLSDSFTSATQVSPLSWTAASLEVFAALALAVVGLRVLGRRGGLESASRPYPAQRQVIAGALHPLAAVLILSHLITLVVSFFHAYG